MEETRKGFSATVLVVDDEPQILRILTSSLEEKGYTVLSASDAESAEMIVLNYPEEIRLLVTDVILPGMNGIELGRKLKNQNPNLHVMLMSGFSEEVLSQHGLFAGNSDFIQKPFSIHDFRKKTREVMQQMQQP